MMLSIHSLLGSKDLSVDAKKIVFRYFCFASIMRGVLMLSNTFLFLFVVDKIGLMQSAFLITLAFIIQGVTDYPLGGVSDKIGQKNILFCAYVVHTIVFLLITSAHTFGLFFIIYSFEAFAKSMESGALDSWFDNNYKAVSTEYDPNLVVYRQVQMKMEMFIGFFVSLMFLLGGIIAYLTFRELVFGIQSVVMLLIGLVTLLYLNNFYESKEDYQEKYMTILSRGITVLVASPRLLVFVIAVIVVSTTITIWGELILFIYYFSYSGSDAVAGLFRFIIWIFSSLFVGLASNYMKKLETKKNMFKLHLLHPIAFFFVIASIITFFPMINKINILVMVLTIFIFSFTAILRTTSDIMRKEVYIELVPNKVRNSFYSLISTLIALISAPVITIFGILITNYGFVYSIILLGFMELLAGSIFYVSFYLPTSWNNYSKVRSYVTSPNQDSAPCC